MLSSVTDALGNTTSYGYDAQTGVLNWVQAPGETAETRTNYTYDNLYRTTQVEKDGTSNSYTYTDDLLAGITSASDTAYTFTYGVFDQIASVKAGDRTLISHTYTNDANRRLSKSEYGNGDYITYAYDSYGRITKTGYEDNANALEYVYDNNGNLGLQKDNIAERTTKYYYDMQDRLMRYDVSGSGYSNSVKWSYDDLNNLIEKNQYINGTRYTTRCSYDKDNRITSTANSSNSNTYKYTTATEYSYDVFSRMSGLVSKSNSDTVSTTTITYKNPSSTTTSSQVATWKNQAANYNRTYTYVYNGRGNITSISDSTGTITYEYDDFDQLIRENNQAANKTWTYSYDNGGNILEKKEYAYTTGTLGTPINTITYGYTDSTWKDLLTSYDGAAVTSDEIGNMLSDGTWSYTWQHGRQLASATDGTKNVNYTYDADGLRTAKTVDGTTYIYIYDGDKLVQMLGGGYTRRFTYDELGPSTITQNGTIYYYVKNAQGDITAILNSSGSIMVGYVYDAWGNIQSVYGPMATTLGAANPLRYRGYIYDTETGLYYLQTRYYDPTIGRFICADNVNYLGADGSQLSYNLFAYCMNNPTNRFDADGNWSLPNWAKIAIGAVVLAGAVALTVATGGGAAAVAVGVAKVVGSVALSTAVSAGAGYLQNGKQGAIDGACNGFMFGSLSALGGAAFRYAKVRSATTGSSNSMGQAGERLAGIDQSAKQPIQINGRTRIPDALTKTTLTEVKNVRYISNTLQLRDFAAYANATGRSLELWVRPTTRIAKTVLDAGWRIKKLW